MKKVLIAAMSVLFCFLFMPSAVAVQSEQEAWLGGLWDSIDADTKELLSEVGINGVDADIFLSADISDVFKMIGRVIKKESLSPMKCAATVLLLTVFTSFAETFVSDSGSTGRVCGAVGHLTVLFALLSYTGGVFAECIPAISLTKDFMLCLLPVFTGIIGFSGSPVCAVGWGGAVFAFAEGVSVLFSDFVPIFSALGAAVSAASSLDPELNFPSVGKLISKSVTVVCGFIAAVFSALLSLKGIIAGAADTVTLRGAKFVIGQSIPIVGSAIGDALNSVVAGIGLVKNTLGVFALIVVVLINLVPLIRLFIWKFMFSFFSVSAELIGRGRIKDLSDSLGGVLSALICVVCFNMLVFLVGITVILVFTGK